MLALILGCASSESEGLRIEQRWAPAITLAAQRALLSALDEASALPVVPPLARVEQRREERSPALGVEPMLVEPSPAEEGEREEVASDDAAETTEQPAVADEVAEGDELLANLAALSARIDAQQQQMDELESRVQQLERMNEELFIASASHRDQLTVLRMFVLSRAR